MTSFCQILHPGCCNPYIFFKKIDGVGPVDNRPSADNLPRFVPPPKK